ncbi:NAD(P)H-quinone oxidoreductase subunit 4 [Lyngbya confervoides]|uniref:NAD(P)H-quinone oxidoreductase chain 4 n=1 Tax=Lyngbya confervoides BDU141951 TaxID=1574623 RepID=A0ABD4T7K2_9CYAN|nr:NAD(P)H-quinone oxidoreductase subunit 4 [Lyngbya confervoides]MCM1984267.1 NAD(P)H-quinone oxidoreductase subunit 4 [Lyngbya confervoides BDU141951]
MIEEQFPWLTLLIAFPAIAALAVPILPDRDGKTLRWYALGVGLIDLAMTVYAFWTHYDVGIANFQMAESFAWIPQIGLNWSLAVDGLSMPLIVLTGFINTLALFAAWNVKRKPRLFYALMLVLYSAQIGVFAAQDMLLFFLMWELELVPVYLLISIWGGPKRQYAATKFILYTAAASIFILVAGLALAFSGDTFTLDMAALAQKHYPMLLEMLAYAGFLIAFGVKLPIFPLHTWLPDAHGEASAPVSMILAGVLLKMGGYGLIRMNIEMLPNAHIHFAPVLAILGVVNIVYGALNAFGQGNLKRCLACSSISHMGFVLLGLAAFTEVGMNGAVMQMVSHGLIAAALFFLAGVAYERTHTLTIQDMGGLGKVMPKAFALFTTCVMASLALPGMSGFVGELMIFLGITGSDVYSQSFKVILLLLAAVGVILTPIYLLSMLRRVFYGKDNQGGQESNTAWLDANPREVFVALCLMVPMVGIGLYPKLAMQTYDVKTTQVVAELQDQIAVVAQQRMAQAPELASQILTAPSLSMQSKSTVLGMLSP